MADVTRSEGSGQPRPARRKLSLGETWRRLNVEQRVAAVGALLLIVSTLGPFSFVEGAIVLIGASVLLLLRRRSEGREFHIPFGDGAIIAAAGFWAAILILVRLFSRPLGQGLLALVCAAILVLAGIREHAKRPADDLPPEARKEAWRPDPGQEPDEPFAGLPPRTEPVADRAAYRDETLPLRDEGPAEGEAAADEAEPQPRPAKVLPPPPRDQDLKQPPRWEDQSGRG